jgi:hypothetical protein
MTPRKNTGSKFTCKYSFSDARVRCYAGSVSRKHKSCKLQLVNPAPTFIIDPILALAIFEDDAHDNDDLGDSILLISGLIAGVEQRRMQRVERRSLRATRQRLTQPRSPTQCLPFYTLANPPNGSQRSCIHHDHGFRRQNL